ncbi:MAG TPA: Uma2 family endonuclease [Armatimonadota bacterium]|nr:Uma2 family endonuclease [Armatimonadota bacterium]
MAVTEAALKPMDRASVQEELPPLENGAHLDQPTFHARYKAMPEHVRAELIGGIVFMASPVRQRHGRGTVATIAWLAGYEEATPGTEVLGDVTLILDDESQPEPDALLRILPEYGGHTRVEDGYVVGAAELVVEVAFATESIDLNRKLADYERAGIEEYVVVLVRAQEVRWFALEEGRYQPLEPDADGLFHSRRFPGLWLDPQALLRGDLARLRQVVQAGAATPEHAEWVARLASQRTPEPPPEQP